jgi:hypothetical protein
VVLTVLSVLYFDARIRSSASAAALSAGRRAARGFTPKQLMM